MAKPPKEKPVIIIDSREQLPYFFTLEGNGHTIDKQWGNARFQRDGLVTGDYTVKGYEDKVCIERKTLGDFVSSLGRNHKRFVNELVRMGEIPYSFVLIEADQRDYVQDVKGAFTRIITMHVKYQVQFVWQGNRFQAERYCFGYMTTFFRKARAGEITL